MFILASLQVKQDGILPAYPFVTIIHRIKAMKIDNFICICLLSLLLFLFCVIYSFRFFFYQSKTRNGVCFVIIVLLWETTNMNVSGFKQFYIQMARNIYESQCFRVYPNMCGVNECVESSADIVNRQRSCRFACVQIFLSNLCFDSGSI